MGFTRTHTSVSPGIPLTWLLRSITVARFSFSPTCTRCVFCTDHCHTAFSLHHTNFTPRSRSLLFLGFTFAAPLRFLGFTHWVLTAAPTLRTAPFIYLACTHFHTGSSRTARLPCCHSRYTASRTVSFTCTGYAPRLHHLRANASRPHSSPARGMPFRTFAHCVTARAACTLHCRRPPLIHTLGGYHLPATMGTYHVWMHGKGGGFPRVPAASFHVDFTWAGGFGWIHPRAVHASARFTDGSCHTLCTPSWRRPGRVFLTWSGSPACHVSCTGSPRSALVLHIHCPSRSLVAPRFLTPQVRWCLASRSAVLPAPGTPPPARLEVPLCVPHHRFPYLGSTSFTLRDTGRRAFACDFLTVSAWDGGGDALHWGRPSGPAPRHLRCVRYLCLHLHVTRSLPAVTHAFLRATVRRRW